MEESSVYQSPDEVDERLCLLVCNQLHSKAMMRGEMGHTSTAKVPMSTNGLPTLSFETLSIVVESGELEVLNYPRSQILLEVWCRVVSRLQSSSTVA